jgi:hypothetical protein
VKPPLNVRQQPGNPTHHHHRQTMPRPTLDELIVEVQADDGEPALRRVPRRNGPTAVDHATTARRKSDAARETARKQFAADTKPGADRLAAWLRDQLAELQEDLCSGYRREPAPFLAVCNLALLRLHNLSELLETAIASYGETATLIADHAAQDVPLTGYRLQLLLTCPDAETNTGQV